MPLSDERLAEIREKRNAATPGEWEVCDANEGMEHGSFWMVTNDAFHNPPADEDEPWLALELHTGIKADAEFIADAPAAIDELLAAYDEQRAENERLRAKVAAVEALAETWGNASQSYTIYKRPFGAAIRAALASGDEVHDG